MEAANALKDAEPDWFGYSCTHKSCTVPYIHTLGPVPNYASSKSEARAVLSRHQRSRKHGARLGGVRRVGMPAHNAVVGAAVAGAIGVAAYTKYQQAQIEREEREATEEREKLIRDAKELREREEEKEGIDAARRTEANYSTSRAKEDILVADLLRDVYQLTKRRQQESGKASIDLPLVNFADAPDSAVEATLGIGLLLGIDPNSLIMALSQLGASPSLGVAAGSLTRETLLAIANLLGNPPSLGLSPELLSSLDKPLIPIFLYLTYLRDPPAVADCTIVTTKTATQSEQLRSLAQHLGLSIYPWEWLQKSSCNFPTIAGMISVASCSAGRDMLRPFRASPQASSFSQPFLSSAAASDSRWAT